MSFILKTWEKLKGLFRQGLSPKQLSLSITIAILVSIFPIFGITTIVLTALAVPLKLNLPIMIIISYATEPLKVVLLIPFIKMGGKVFKADHSLLTFQAIKDSYEASFWTTVKDLSYELVCGFTGWLITIPIAIAVYFILKSIISLIYKMKTKNI